MGKQRLTLYVMSSKNLVSQAQGVEKATVSVSTTESMNRVPGFGSMYHDKSIHTKTCFVLPEDQKIIVEMVKEIASMLGLEVDVVDVAKKSAFHKAIKREPKITMYPTLMMGLTSEQVETFLACIQHEKGSPEHKPAHQHLQR